MIYKNKEYREIPGYENKYFISSNGEVLSNKRQRIFELKNSILATGYKVIGLYKEIGEPAKFYSIASLILEAWVEPKPSDLHKAFYKDRNKNNICLGNLEWKTKQEIMQINRSLCNAQTKPRKIIIAVLDGLVNSSENLDMNIGYFLNTGRPNKKGIYFFTPEKYEEWMYENS